MQPQPWSLCCATAGWALCGHDAPAGEGAGCCSDGEGDNDADAEDRDGAGPCSQGKEAGGTRGGRDGAMATEAGAAAAAAAAALSGSKRARSPEAAGGDGDGGEGAAAAAVAASGVEGKLAQQEVEQGFDPARCLSRCERMTLGQKCKQLIEAGRLEWLRGRFGACELVCYVGPEVTGENRLLLAVV